MGMERAEEGGFSPQEQAEVFEMTKRVQSEIDFYEPDAVAYGRQRVAFERVVKNMSVHDQLVLEYVLKQIGTTYGMYRKKDGVRYRDRIADLRRFVNEAPKS